MSETLLKYVKGKRWLPSKPSHILKLKDGDFYLEVRNPALGERYCGFFPYHAGSHEDDWLHEDLSPNYTKMSKVWGVYYSTDFMSYDRARVLEPEYCTIITLVPTNE